MVLNKRKRDFIKLSRDLANIGSFGFLMAGAILLGYFAGNFLDNYFGTSPWLLILFLLLGVAGGFTEYLKIIKKYMKDQDRNDENNG